MIVRYQTVDGKNHTKEIIDRMGTLDDEEDQAVFFLQELGPSLKGATFYRGGIPFKSFANELVLRQTNP